MSSSPVPGNLRRLPTAAALLLALVPVAACSNENVAVLHTDSGKHTFNIEIADDGEERARGLMFRQELGANEGMLFDFFDERPVAFWMRNTFIPLDMIFINDDGTVENIHANARPQDPTSIPSAEPVRFVLEIPGGRAAEIGLEPGDLLEHPRLEN